MITLKVGDKVWINETHMNGRANVPLGPNICTVVNPDYRGIGGGDTPYQRFFAHIKNSGGTTDLYYFYYSEIIPSPTPQKPRLKGRFIGARVSQW